jgi:hypothetical protein
MLLAAATLALSPPPAHQGKGYELLGQPCRAKQVLAGRVVVDRTDGRELFVLTNDNETFGAELIFIDVEKNTGKVYPAPAGAGSWALNEVPGDRLVVGTFYDGAFMVFDLKKREFVKTAKFAGESYIWNLAMGSDGRIYGGTYPSGKLGALDLNSYTIEDCGAPAPPNQYLRNVSATPEGLILCSLGMQNPTTLLYDPATKQFGPVPDQLKGASMGASWNGYFVAGSRFFKGKELQVVDPAPFPAPLNKPGNWYADPYLTTRETLYFFVGSSVYRYRAGESKPTFISSTDLHGGRLLAGTADGSLLGVRGQDYFLLREGDRGLNPRAIPVECRARPTLFLKADPEGHLWGGPHFGQTLFCFTPRTRTAINTDSICDAGGEVYDATFLNGCVYAASYAGGDITLYDPRQLWDQLHHKNPRPLASVGPDFIRPTAGIRAGADGKLYSGWMAKYGAYGGAVAITDPETGRTDRIDNPLGAQAVTGLAVDGHLAYVGTSLGANGLPDKEGELPRFGIYNLQTHRLEGAPIEFKEGHQVGPIVLDAKTKRLALIVGGALKVFDTVSRELVKLPAEVRASAIVAPGKGSVLAASEKQVLRIDLHTFKSRIVAELPDSVDTMAVDSRGTIYVTCGADLYRLR